MALSVMFSAFSNALAEAAIAKLDGKSAAQVRQALYRGFVGGITGFFSGFARYYGWIGKAVVAARKRFGG